MVENYESKPHIPPDPIAIGLANSIFFPLHNLDDCLSELKEGVVFSGVTLKNFRESNRACLRINTTTSIAGGVIAANMLRGKGELSKACGLLILAYAAVQAKRGREKSRRQISLDSKDSISSQDL